jgi:hypothetical protein
MMNSWSRHARCSRIVIAAALCAVTMGLSGCEKKHFQWTEDVRLADGSTVQVERTVRYGKVTNELGGPTSRWVSEATITIVEQGSRLPTWSLPMQPFLLDKDPATGRWLLVASAMEYCDYASRFGAPFVTFPTFELNNAEWIYVGLPESMVNRTANLLLGVPGESRGDDPHLTADDIAISNEVRLPSIEWRSVHPKIMGYCALEHSRK